MHKQDYYFVLCKKLYLKALVKLLYLKFAMSSAKIKLAGY